MSIGNGLDDVIVIPRYFMESTHCNGLSYSVSDASEHLYLGPIAIQCDFRSLNCKHISLPVKAQMSSNFCYPDTDGDNNIKSSAYIMHATQVRLK